PGYTPPTPSSHPTYDAHVQTDSPNNNYTTQDHLRTRGVSAPLYNAYLKFNLSGISSPIQRATLRLFSYDGSPNGGSIYQVANTYQGSGTEWTETGLNWNNAPLIEGTPLATHTSTIPNNTWVEYDVTAAITGNGVVSFAITSNTSNSLYFYSRQAATNQPVLVVEFGDGPTYTATNTPTPTATFTPTDTPTPTATFTPTDTPTITDTFTATYTPSPTATPTNTGTPSP